MILRRVADAGRGSASSSALPRPTAPRSASRRCCSACRLETRSPMPRWRWRWPASRTGRIVAGPARQPHRPDDRAQGRIGRPDDGQRQIRAAAADQVSGLRAYRAAHARARHRRLHGDVQPGQRRAAAAAARSAIPTVWCGSRTSAPADSRRGPPGWTRSRPGARSNTSFESLAGYFAFFDFGRRQTMTGIGRSGAAAQRRHLRQLPRRARRHAGAGPQLHRRRSA